MTIKSKIENRFVHIANGRIPDGYFGDYADVSFCFDPETGNTIAKHSKGYFTYHTPKAINSKEAQWLLKHHPNASKIMFLTLV